MTYEITIKTADNISSTDLVDNVSTEVDASNFILSDRQSEFSLREETFDKPAHNYARYYVSDKVDPTAVVSNFETVVANTDWAEIEGRHVWYEYEQDEYLHDESYYPYGADNILRSPPKIEYVEGFEGGISEVYFLIGGEEYSVTDKTLKFSEPTDYIRQDAVVAESDGSVSVIEGTEHANPKENDIEWPKRPDTPKDAKVGAYVTVKSALDRIPRSGIEIVDVVGDAGERTVDYSHGTIPDNI